MRFISTVRSASSRLKRALRPVLGPARAYLLTMFRRRRINSRPQFEKLARRNDIPGMKDIWVCKFLVVDIDGPSPMLFFMNTRMYEHHFLYYRRVTGRAISEPDFDAISYYSNAGRKNLAGSLVAHDNYCDDKHPHGIYSIDYWPTDPVSFTYVALTWDLITEAMPFARERIVYHLSSQTQMDQFRTERALYEGSPIRWIDTDHLFSNLTFIPLNLGDSYGILKIMNEDEIPAFRDIVIFRSLPNDLSHVRGIITDVPQTPLSHVNLKAKQNAIPNAYIKNASAKEAFRALVNKPVRFTVTADGYQIEAATMNALDDHFQRVAPHSTRVPAMDMSQTTIAELRTVSKGDSAAFGAKAANMGEVYSLLPDRHTISGHAIPFHFYDRFMQENDFYPVIEAMIRDKNFAGDIQYMNRKLEEFQKILCKGTVPEWLSTQIREMQDCYPDGTDLRLRSSSNSEDLENFNGAGLYASGVHFHHHGPIENDIKKIWASLWTYRAFTEREFHRIDHSQIAMGLLVHQDQKNEQNNGVAVTRNLFGSIHKGLYINVQAGQSLVTNPDVDALPDELVVSAIGGDKEFEIQTIRRSNLVPAGQSVMSETQVIGLIRQSRIIHDHFKTCYQAEDDETFAMELEFLTTTDGDLKIMQARPWLD